MKCTITEERLNEIIENAYKNGFNDGQAEGLRTPKSHKEDTPYTFFKPSLDCDCDVCKDAREAHDTVVVISERERIYNLIKAERDPSLEYVDWDSVEAVFIRLRDDVK